MDGPLEEPYERNRMDIHYEDPFLRFSAVSRLFSVSLLPRDIIENIDSKPSIESSPTYSNPSQAYSYPVTYPVNLEERNEPASNLQNIDEPAKKISAETDDSDNTQTTTQESSKPEDKPYRPWTNVEEAYLKSNLPYPRSHGVSSKVDPKLLTELQRRESQKLEKWQKILPTLESSLEKSNSTVKSLIRKGIPTSLRRTIWPMLANVAAVKQAFKEINYNDILNTDDIPFKEDIYQDVMKTCGTANEQRSLAKVLSAITIAYRQIGYCRGVNFICGVLLKYCSEEDAFWIMISLMENYDLLGYYKDIVEAGKQLLTLDELINVQLPKLYAHLANHRVQSINFTITWWMTLFTGDPGLPFNTVARIMDSLLFEKKKILFRVSLAILKGKEKDLMMMKGAETMMSFITNDFRSPFWFDEDAFMKTVFALQLSRKDIERIEANLKGSPH